MNDEVIIRKQAIVFYLEGNSVVEIAAKLGKTRQWVYKWLNRYNEGKSDWFCSMSNAPKKPGKHISERTEQVIINIRQNLQAQKYAQKGALNILYEFERHNLQPPSIATINRVLKRNSLIEVNDTKIAKKKSIRIIFIISSKWILSVPDT